MPEERFSFRWGIPWLDASYLQIPNFFFDHYHELDVSPSEFAFILHLARYKFESPRGRARPSLATVAKEMGYTRRGVRKIRRSLEEKTGEDPEAAEGQVQEIKESLENRGLLIVTEIPGRPSDYNFENFARACLRRAQGVGTPVPPEPQFLPTPEPQFLGGRNPSSSEEQEQNKKTTTTPVVALSKSAEERESAESLLLGIGIRFEVVDNLCSKFSLQRIISVVRIAKSRSQVRDKAAWVKMALDHNWQVRDVSGDPDIVERLRVSRTGCAWRRNHAMGECPLEEEGKRGFPWCDGCERAAAVLAKEDADQ